MLLANLSMTAFRNIIYGMNDGSFAYNLIMFAKSFMWIPYYTCFFIADIVFGDEYPDPRIRGRSNAGLGRTQIYFGKFAAELIILVAAALFALVAFLTITPIFQIHDGTIDKDVVLDFMTAVLVSMPLFATGVSFGHMFLFSSNTKKKAFAYYVLFIIVIPRLLMFLATDQIGMTGLRVVTNLLVTPQFQTLPFYATRNVPKILISSCIYMALSLGFGCFKFNRKKF